MLITQKMGTTWKSNFQQSEFLKFEKLNKNGPYVPRWRRGSHSALKQRTIRLPLGMMCQRVVRENKGGGRLQGKRQGGTGLWREPRLEPPCTQSLLCYLQDQQITVHLTVRSDLAGPWLLLDLVTSQCSHLTQA